MSMSHKICKDNEGYIEHFKKEIKPFFDEKGISLVLSQGRKFKDYSELVFGRLKNIIQKNTLKIICPPNPFKRILISRDGAAINIVLTYFFIRFNGSIGVVQALLATFFLQFMFTWYLSAKFYPLPRSLKITPLRTVK